MQPGILTINGGSSSIKYALFTPDSPPKRIDSGQIDRIETGDSVPDNLLQKIGNSPLAAIGHRIVHGGLHLLDHQKITPEVLTQLRQAQPLDLMHLPREIALIEKFQQAFPSIPQFACFDTAFFRDLPRTSALLPIPRHYYDSGIRRFGFHGLSYTYLMQRLTQLATQSANARIILAHLGSGASMAAILNNKPIDTTMAFTPTAGLIMATRPGDIDPGLIVYLLRIEKFTPDQLDVFLSTQCGLKGLSESTSDMRDLLARRDQDPKAADAIDLFCYQAKKYLASLAAALGGLDTLVFSAGIGEHSPQIRATICQDLPFLGLTLDPSKNQSNAEIISTPDSKVTVRLIPTDEEIVIAQTVKKLLY
jgi:acetate kinase